jgi:hypothetical protein
MIILTADHSSKPEAHTPERTHVPLIIKLPGQQRAYAIDKPFRNNRLGPVIESVMRGLHDEAEILSMILDAE